MKLSDLIASRGPEACAQSWGVSVHTVRAWSSGRRVPNRRHLAVILETRGASKLDVAQLYGLARKSKRVR